MYIYIYIYIYISYVIIINPKVYNQFCQGTHGPTRWRARRIPGSHQMWGCLSGYKHIGMGQNLVTLVNPLKMVFIGIDPWAY